MRNLPREHAYGHPGETAYGHPGETVSPEGVNGCSDLLASRVGHGVSVR